MAARQGKLKLGKGQGWFVKRRLLWLVLFNLKREQNSFTCQGMNRC